MSAMPSSSSAPDDFNPQDVHISVDLVPAARNLLEFLKDISSKQELFEEPFVECAIQRYERFWLPLMAKYPGRILPAPLDIEWIWQCHLLAPDKYCRDCERIAGKLIDHHLIDKPRRNELLKDSERLWKSEYADVPFSDSSGVAASWFDSNFVSTLSYNIKSAVSRQKIFFYQVSLPHYRDEKFLTNALLRYKKFLYLKCHNPNVFLVPCYDNDLIWHSHMMFPVCYKDDTQAYLGVLLSHDDSVNDRKKGSKLCVSEAKTRVLWKKVFNEKSSYFGAMFRGQPPYSKLHAMTKDDVYRLATKQVNVLIEKVRITGLPQGKAFKLKLCYNTGYQNFNRSLFVTENIATVKGNSSALEDYRINTKFSFDTRYNDKLIASIQKKSGRLCLGTSDILGEGNLDLQRKVQPLKTRGLTANDDIDCGDGMSVGVVWSCPSPELGPCVFRLEPGEYQGCVMPPDRESLWGPIPLPRLPPGAESTCSVASHKLYNHMRKPVFTVRMIHSEPMLMSAIHVFSGDKMTSVAHLIVGDHLPLPSSVSEPKKCVTLNPKEGQRAVLIKNHKGDWGVAVGWWEGIHRRGSGRKGSCSEGHLEVRFFHLPTHKWQYVSFDSLYSLATSKFGVGDCSVEFDSGFIAIDSQRCEISENVALIFSITLIHVLCQPRPTNWAPGLSSPATSQIEGSGIPPSLRLGGSEEITLLIAAGILISTPSNHAIRNLFKKKKHNFGEVSVFKKMLATHENESEEIAKEPEPEPIEANGGPAMILHEAEVNPGWDKRKQVGKIVAATRLMSISEKHGDETAEEEEEEKEEEEEGKKNPVAVSVALGSGVLLAQEIEASREEVTCEDSSKTKSSGKDEVEDNDEGEDSDGDNESKKEEDGDEEGVFAVEDYGSEGDGQTCMFGDGESDSDEVQADDDDVADAGFTQGVLMDEEDAEEDVDDANNDDDFIDEDNVIGENEEVKEEEEAAGEDVEDQVEEFSPEAGDDVFGNGDVYETDAGDYFGKDDGDVYGFNDADNHLNGMVNGYDDEYLEDDAETFYNEFYNMDGENNHDSQWGGESSRDVAWGDNNHEVSGDWGETDGGSTAVDKDDDVFLPSEQYNGYGDHASNYVEDTFDSNGCHYNDHNNASFGYEHNSHISSFGSGSAGLPDKDVDGREYALGDYRNQDRDHDRDHHGNPANYSYEGMNGEIPASLDILGDGGSGTCGGCGG